MKFFAWFGSRKQRDLELDEEIRAHLAMPIRERIEQGQDPREAEANARREFGNVTLVKEVARDVWGCRWLEILLQDIRYSLRQLRRNPGFTAVAIITLALGIGANTAIFSVVECVMLTPLPYAQPDRLAAVWQWNQRMKSAVFDSYPNFQDRQREAQSFEQMAAFTLTSFDLTSPGMPAHLDGKAISSGFFATLGIRLALGREFTPQEDQQGGARVVIVSNGFWRNRLASSPEALGKSVTLDGIAYTVVGVLPLQFHLEGDADVYTPLGEGNSVLLNNRAIHPGIMVIARLTPGASISRAQAEMRTIQQTLDQLYPDANRGLGAEVVPLKQQIIGKVGGTILLLLGAVGLVLVIACANVANLLLARSAARRRELAIRFAMGAGRARVVRQLLTESVLLSAAGGSLGVATAVWGVKPLVAIVPGSLPRSESIHVDGLVLLFAFAISLTVGILFGLAPALKSSDPHLETCLKEGSRGSRRIRRRGQSSLVILQFALTLVLLVGAGLMLRTVRHLWETNPGFDVQHIITFKVGLLHKLTRTASATKIAYQQLIERIRQVPGVQAADFTNLVPLTPTDNLSPFWVSSQHPASYQEAPRLNLFWTGPDYLQTMEVPLLRGRFFTTEDTISSARVIVIDSVLARSCFPAKDPVGQSIYIGNWGARIIGVVAHVRHWGLGNASQLPRAQAYASLNQLPDQWVPVFYGDLTVLIRTSLASSGVMPAIRNIVYGAGRHQPVYDVQTMQEIVSESMASQRLPMILLGTFAGLALLLASVGIYGVISYSVAQRVHEIAIRIALGADKRDVLRLVIGEGLQLALAGLTVGVAAAFALTRLISIFSSLLYKVGTSDPVTFVGVSLVLLGVALLACYIPARRAAKVDPMVALRSE
jgi:predicted permease